MRLLVSAGEPSGDAHAARVIGALASSIETLDVEGIGGPAMAAVGVRLLARMERLSATGLVEAVGHAPRHLRLLHHLTHRIRDNRYDLVLLVDYPGFHLRVATAAARAGIPVLYYIAPQLWAWGAWRMGRLRAAIRALAVILPFEQGFFSRHGISATFVGHPLLDRPPGPAHARAREALGIEPDVPVLALMPGTRPHEWARHWRLFEAAARHLRARLPELETILVGTPPQKGNAVRISTAQAPLALAAADAALTKAGTITLEAALAELPMVIAHRVHPFTHAVARRLVQLPHVGLVNLLAGQDVIPEFLQREASPATLAAALYPLFDPDHPATRRQRLAFRDLRPQLGTPGAAARVATLARDLVS